MLLVRMLESMENGHTLADQAAFRNYLLFWSGQLVSLLGSSIVQFAIIWWITVVTGSAMYLALASFLGLAPLVVVGPFAGVFADRWNRKKLVFVADLMQALAIVVLIIFYWIGNVVIWQVLAVLTVRAVFQAFHEPTVSAITPSMVPKDKLSRMNGLNYLFSGAVRLAGPVSAAVLLQFWQIQQILWIDALTFLAAMVPLLIIKIPFVRTSATNSSFKDELRQGFSFVRRARGMLTIAILATSLNFLITPLSTLLPYFVKFDHLGGAAELALVMAFFEGGILGGGLFMSLKKGFEKKIATAIVSIIIAFSGYALIALTPSGLFWFMALSALVFAVCLPVANVLLQTIMQTVVPLDMQGRVNSVTMALSMAAQPAGTLISGAIVQFTMTYQLFLGCSLAGIAIAAASWFFTDIRHLEALAVPSDSMSRKLP
jgi:DHA3 family macrolide efflux protein-like MFS transporter